VGVEKSWSGKVHQIEVAVLLGRLDLGISKFQGAMDGAEKGVDKREPFAFKMWEVQTRVDPNRVRNASFELEPSQHSLQQGCRHARAAKLLEDKLNLTTPLFDVQVM
jgi:hypothetical protein